MHGNHQNYTQVTDMINRARSKQAYISNPRPIVFNEDDDYGFDRRNNNFQSAIDLHASWGVFVDCNRTTAGDYIYGYQCIPAAWNINTPLKQSFFDTVRNYTSTSH